MKQGKARRYMKIFATRISLENYLAPLLRRASTAARGSPPISAYQFRK